MFALTPQTITTPEGLSQIAASNDPAGETAAGTAFAQVMAAMPPPAAAHTGPTCSLGSPALAEPVLTASLLAWPDQPTQSAPLIAPDLLQNMDPTVDLPAPNPVNADDIDTGNVEPPSGAVEYAVIVEPVTLPTLDPLQVLPEHGAAPLPEGSGLPRDQPDAAFAAGLPTSVTPPVAPNAATTAPAPTAINTAALNTGALNTAALNTGAPQGRPNVPKSGDGTVTNPVEVTPRTLKSGGVGKPEQIGQNLQTRTPPIGHLQRITNDRSPKVAIELPMSDTPVDLTARGPGATSLWGASGQNLSAPILPEMAASQTTASVDHAQSTAATTGAERSGRPTALPIWPPAPTGVTASQPDHIDLSTSATTAPAPRVPADIGQAAIRPKPEAATGRVAVRASARGTDGPVDVTGLSEQIAFVVKQPVGLRDGGQTQQDPRWAAPANTPKVDSAVATPTKAQFMQPAPVETAVPPAQTSDVALTSPSQDKAVAVLSVQGGPVRGSSVQGSLVRGSLVRGRSQTDAIPPGPAPQAIAPQGPAVPTAQGQTTMLVARQGSPLPVWSAPDWTKPAHSAEGHATQEPTMRSPTVSPHGPDVAAEPVAQQWPIRAPNGLDMSAKAPIRQSNPPQVLVSRLPVLDSPHRRSPLVQAPGTAGQMALPHGGPNPATTPQPDRRDMADIPTERPNWPEGRVQASGRSAQIDPTLRPKDASSAIMAPALTRGTMRTGDAAAAPQQTAPTRPAAQIARGGTDGHAGPNANGTPPQTVMAPGQTLADPGTPPEPIVAHQSVEKPTRKTADQPVATPLATDKAAPRPATAPFVYLTTPRPDLASFWQSPTANHGWQTALQFWTPPIPLAKPPARAAMPPSASSAVTAPEPVPMNLASTLNVAEPLHGDDRPRPVSAKKARESAPDSPALPTPLPIAAPAPAAMSSGPVFVPQTATSGDVDGAVAYAPLPATAATPPTPMILTSHLPKGVPESLARAAKEERSELLLDPMELGKVRFELVTTGDKVQINLSVERPETLDLLRRNMDSLHREFREAGFDTSTLTFGQWGKGQEEGRQAPLTAQFGDDPDLPDTAPAPTARTNRNTSSQGLDLRM